MKKNILITIAACILMFTQNSFAQDIWVAAISSSGILLGNNKIADNSINPIPTPITLEEAKNIFTINILETGKDRKVNRVKVKSYQMTIMNEDESTTSITNNRVFVLSICFKNSSPKPPPSLAPSIIPGISAITKEL